MNLEQRLSQLEAAMLTANVAAKEILTFDEACVYMGVSRSFMYKCTSTNRIPHYKPSGRMIYFKKEELAEWIFTEPRFYFRRNRNESNHLYYVS